MEVIKLSVDFGLVVLIWMVQLIIYPGFRYYEEKMFLRWHKHYAILISLIVGPLMIVQASIHIFELFYDYRISNLATFFLILGCWLITFLSAMPLHNKIDQGVKVNKYVKKLVSVNRYRTFGWTSVYLIILSQYIFGIYA